MGLDPRSFPAIERKESDETRATIRISAAKLRELIEKSVFCVAKDEARYNLAGVYLEMMPTGALRCVATDGHRLGMIERGVDEGAAISFKPVILPRRGVTELAKILASFDAAGEIVLIIKSDIVTVAFDDTEITMRLVEGEFPDYRGVIPKEPKHRCSVSHEALAAAIRRVAVFSNERYRAVKFTFETGTLRLSSTSPDTGEATEDIDLDGFDGDGFSTGFNAIYLQQALATMPEDAGVTLAVTDETSPVLMTTAADPEFAYIVMPMRT
jgi:DNA polymerase-3 subunit beta